MQSRALVKFSSAALQEARPFRIEDTDKSSQKVSFKGPSQE